MRRLRYVLCDVFTDRPLEGNQLAVFTNAAGVPTEMMQALAREMNLSEATFVLPAEKGGHARIRIFTPRHEMPFAGHPTLGSAIVIGESVQLDLLRLETQKQIVPVRFERGAGGTIRSGWMEQPLPAFAPVAEAETGPLLRALGVPASSLPIEVYDNGVRHAFVALDSREMVAKLAPDLVALAKLPDYGFNTFAGSGSEWKTRMFAPGHGVAEDPATGSAAGPLAVHLARHGRIRFGDEIRIEQGAELLRPSVLYARASGTAEKLERVEVGGSAVIIGRGEIQLR